MMQKANVLGETAFCVSHREQELLHFRSACNTKRGRINVRMDQNHRK